VLGDADLVAFVATADAGRARDFYERVLELRLVEDGPFALVFDAGGVPVRVQKVDRVSPPSGTVLGWSVPDVGAVVRGLSERGVSVLIYDGMSQDELGIWTSPGGARIAWFSDPDGNVLSVTESAVTRATARAS
jgi:catechol 2,3-dioxygenase-like lactoylglutathione lyase family enzyme